VFNLAAHVGGLYHNITHQAEMHWGNMQCLVPPALAAAQLGVPVYLDVSTVCIYSRGRNNPAIEVYGHEGEPEQGNAGYAWAKRMGELVCHWAFENAKTRYVIVRPTNIYGPRDYFDESAHVIPALIRKFSDGRNVVQVYGGAQMREFIYVEDIVRGMMAVAEHGTRGEAYNLGTGGETQVTIRQLAMLINDLTGFQGSISFDSDAPTGDFARSTASNKAHALGWRHEVGLEEGLRRTVEWWKTQNT
jgi:GDP-L-fucose synthase